MFGPVVALGTILGMVIEKTHDNDSMAIVHEALYASWCACGLFAVGHGFYLLPDAADALRLGAAVSVRRDRERRAREGKVV